MEEVSLKKFIRSPPEQMKGNVNNKYFGKFVSALRHKHCSMCKRQRRNEVKYENEKEINKKFVIYIGCNYAIFNYSYKYDSSKCSNFNGKSDFTWAKRIYIHWFQEKDWHMVADEIEWKKSILHEFGIYLPFGKYL